MRDRIRLGLAVVAVAIGLALGLVTGASAQDNTDIGPLITNSARAAGTVTSSRQTNRFYRGILCAYNKTAIGETPTVVFSVDYYDASSTQWLTLVSSDSIQSTQTGLVILAAYPGLNYVVSGPGAGVGMFLPVYWRVSQTITGSGTVTGTIGCQLLK